MRDILREKGNLPVEKEIFTRCAIGYEISVQTSLRILMKFSEEDIKLIIFDTLPDATGDRKIEFEFGLF